MDNNPEDTGCISTGKSSQVALEAAGDSSAPEHLILLRGGQWALWRWVALRGAGFPAAHVLKLSDAACADAADQLLEAEGGQKRARAAALAAVNTALDALRSSGYWDEQAKRSPLMKVMRMLKAGRLPEFEHLSGPLHKAVELLRAAQAQHEAARFSFQQAYLASVVRTSRSIREIIEMDQFREAVIWQNREAFRTGIGSLWRKPTVTTARGFKQRGNEELVASYLQRYCVKNDTVGFFGPVGWARLVSTGEALVVRPGVSLLATREVYFEGWCIDALAAKIAAQEGVRPSLCPRRMPYIFVAGTRLYVPLSKPATINSKLAVVLQACQGELTAKDLSRRLLQNPMLGIRSEQEVYRTLEELEGMGLISWTLEVPLQLHPEQYLRSLLERIEHEDLRAPALQALDEMEAARARVASAAGDPARLDEALAELNATFTSLTGIAPTRDAGKTYAGRTLVYEDCRRDIEMDVGPELIRSLESPLLLLLASARWLTYKLAEICRNVANDLFAELARASGSSTVTAVDLWMKAQPILFNELAQMFNDVQDEFQRRWAKILSLSDGQRHLQLSSDDLLPRVMKEFAAPGAGWPLARYHCPDVMITAASATAIQRGDYQLVLGEMHLAINTLFSSLFVSQHPRPDDFLQALEEDFPEPRFAVVNPKSWPNVTSRTNIELRSPKDLFVTVTYDSIAPPETGTVPISAFIVEDSGNGLVVRTRDGRGRFDLIEAFSDALTGQTINRFTLLRPATHTPRINIDRLVVCREAWNLPADELLFADEADEAERFIAARRLMRERSLPRFVFVKVPVERKPFYVDFASPIYVNIFAKMVRRTRQHAPAGSIVHITEMLPGTDQNWLQNATGQHYTSELRMVAVDLKKHAGII